MKVLDIDMDYFLDVPVSQVSFSNQNRVDREDCIASVWTEERIRDFLENNLGLSKERKIPGRIIIGHDEALYFWDELIQASKLMPPFSVVHVDSHADLDFGGLGKIAVLDEIIYWPIDLRKPRNCKAVEVDYRYYDIDIGNYLLYALAFRWISDLTYCGNPNGDCGDVPPEIVIGGIPDSSIDSITKRTIKLEPRTKIDEVVPNEPEIPFMLCPRIEHVKYEGYFDFASLAQSPNYTPKNADFIMDIFREYIDEI